MSQRCSRPTRNSRLVCRTRPYQCCWHCPVTSLERRCATRRTQNNRRPRSPGDKRTEKNQTLIDWPKRVVGYVTFNLSERETHEIPVAAYSVTNTPPPAAAKGAP